jgi:tetratricopeptide (TPR) repeat protein
MTNKNRKRIIPRNKNFTLTNDNLAPYYKRLFRFVRMDDSMPVYRKTELTRELFMGLWQLERHMVKVSRIQDSLSNGQPIDWNQIENGIAYPETLLLTAYGMLKEKYENEQPVLDETFLREVHDSICEAFRIFYPKPLMEIHPKTATADEFFHRGNVRIHQGQYDEAFADFERANELRRDCDAIEYSLAQYWLQYGKNKLMALTWIDKAIKHLRNNSPLAGMFYHHLRTTICTGLKQYEEAVSSLQISTGALSFMIEKLDWRDGEAKLGRGTIFAEGIRASLSEAIEVSERLLALVNGNLMGQVQSILKTQRNLWKQL